jgi:hypothetical protein
MIELPIRLSRLITPWMTARGETLLLVAALNGAGGSRRTYLELDSTQLP